MKTVIFDYDGTLHDCIRIYEPAVKQTYSQLAEMGKCELFEIPRSSIRRWIGMSPDAMWAELLPGLDKATQDWAIHQVMNKMIELTRAGAAVWYPKAEQVLKELKNKQIPMILLSNCPHEYLEAHRQVFHLDQYFEKIICAEDYGYLPKYRIVKEIIDAGEPFISVGDRGNDMELAKKYHMTAIGCEYGYGSEIELQRADFLVKEAEQLIPLLQMQ